MPTSLSPLEETLFQAWLRANGSDSHDDPNNQFDHRGLYKQANGTILPPGLLNHVAQLHNAANEPQEQTEQQDPMMAVAEMHGNQLKSQGDSRRDALKMQMEREKLQHKTMLEHLKMQHQAAEKEKDRQFKLQESERARQQAIQDTQMQRQHAIADMQVNRQHSVQDQLMQEMMRRSGQPQPVIGGPQ